MAPVWDPWWPVHRGSSPAHLGWDAPRIFGSGGWARLCHKIPLSRSQTSFSLHPRRMLSQGSTHLPPRFAFPGCLLALLPKPLLIARWVSASPLTKARIVIERWWGGPESLERRSHGVSPRCSPVVSPRCPHGCSNLSRPVADPQQGESCSARFQSLQLQNLSRFGSQAMKHPSSSQLVKRL